MQMPAYRHIATSIDCCAPCPITHCNSCSPVLWNGSAKNSLIPWLRIVVLAIAFHSIPNTSSPGSRKTIRRFTSRKAAMTRPGSLRAIRIAAWGAMAKPISAKTPCRREHPRPNAAQNPLPAAGLEIGEYYWGYGSGVVPQKSLIGVSLFWPN